MDPMNAAININYYKYSKQKTIKILNATDFIFKYDGLPGKMYFNKPASTPVINLRAYKQEADINHFHFTMWPDDVTIQIQYIAQRTVLLITTKRETGAINYYSFKVAQTANSTTLTQYWT